MKKTAKSKTAKKMKDLPAKKVSAKTAKGIKGQDGVKESVTFEYGPMTYSYKP